MKEFLSQVSIRTNCKGFTNITNKINNWIKKNRVSSGILIISLNHTSCSLIINENADPMVLEDLSNYFDSLVPEKGFTSLSGDGRRKSYLHNDEGPDDMPAHIRTALTNTSLSLSIQESEVLLGIWQAIYIWEHRTLGSERTMNLHVIGEIRS